MSNCNLCFPVLWKRILCIAVMTVLSFVMVVMSQAQSPRKNIYLFDCTSSMKRGETPIWGPAKDALIKTIERQAKQPNVKFAIVAFRYEEKISESDVLDFDGKEYGQGKRIDALAIDNFLEAAINKDQKTTNIVSALEKGINLCDHDRKNRIYLFTDGTHNYNGQGIERVKDCINKWCKHHSKGDRLFYVMMTKDAIDPDVKECLKHCEDGFAIECVGGIVPQICDIEGSHIEASTDRLAQEYRIRFSEFESLPISIECDDPVFEVADGSATNCEIRMRFVPRRNGVSQKELHNELYELQRGDNYEFTLKVTSMDEAYSIANPEVLVTMSNLPLRELEIFGGTTGALTFPEVEWHDSFLWSEASPEQPVEIDFSPIFESHDRSSAVTFTFKEMKGNPVDYVLTYNGRQLKPGEKITISQRDAESKLIVEFNHDAKGGGRDFILIPEDVRGLDLINELSATDFPSIAINMSYNVCWNPLKTICFWLAVIIVALLGIWFLMIKPAKYRKIDISLLQIEGQAVNERKRVKGYRQVVLSSRRRNQNIISRIFTGKILFVPNAAFTSDIKIERSAKRSVRFYVPRTWSITPIVVKDRAVLKDVNTGKEYTVRVS